MTVWGGNGTLRVGLNVFTDGYDTWTPSINVYIDVYVGSDNYDYGDNQHIELSGSVGAGFDFHNDLPYAPGATQYVGRAIIYGQGQSYGGGPNYSFHAQLSGAFNGAAPAVDVGFTLPPRPTRPPSPPGAPRGNVTATEVDVSWDYPADIGGAGLDYNWLQVFTGSGLTGLIYDNQTPGWVGRHIGGLNPGQTYYARSAAHNNKGWSGWSGTGSWTQSITVSSPPSTPTFSAVDATSLTVNWNAGTSTGGSAPTSWRLQVSNVSNFSSVVNDTTQNNRSRTVTGLTPGGQYFARMAQNNAAGASAWSGVGTVTLPQFTSPGPAIRTIGPDTVAVRLGTPSGASAANATGYEIQIDDVTSFASPATVGGTGYPTTSDITLTGLNPATNYWVRSRANTANGWGSWSPASTFQTLPGVRAKVNGVWLNCQAFFRKNGAWVPVKVNKRTNGTWVY